MHRFLNAILYFLSGFIPRNRRKVLFGAWLGERFADNPKYLVHYLAPLQTGLDLVWVGREHVRSSIPATLPLRFVPRGSLKAYLEMLTAGTCFVTHAMTDLGRFNLMRGACRVQLGHGLAIKHMGSKDHKPAYPWLGALRRVLRQVHSFRYYIASSEAHRTKLIAENATCNISPDQVLGIGQPRIDFILQNSRPEVVEGFRHVFMSSQGIGHARRVITYMPTFRDSGATAFSFAALGSADHERLQALLGKFDAVVLEKSHLADALRKNGQNDAKSARIFALSPKSNVDTQDLLRITDLLITDYSGCYIDFLVLDRPIVHFAYDRQYYEKADRGLYFNLDEVAGGPVVENFDRLCCAIEANLRDPSLGRTLRERVRTKLTEFESATASAQIAERVLGVPHRPMNDGQPVLVEYATTRSG